MPVRVCVTLNLPSWKVAVWVLPANWEATATLPASVSSRTPSGRTTEPVILRVRVLVGEAEADLAAEDADLDALAFFGTCGRRCRRGAAVRLRGRR